MTRRQRHVPEWIRQSNMIEDVYGDVEHWRSAVAWRWLLQQPQLSSDVILGLHKRIMKARLPESQAGHWRDCAVWVAGREGIDWRSIPSMIDIYWLPEHGRANNPDAIRNAHVSFEVIHPFIDGNGRTGRMLMNYQRVQAGLAPLCIRADERHAYYLWFPE